MGKKWTPDEWATFNGMAERGCTASAISEAIDKAFKAVAWRLAEWREDRGQTRQHATGGLTAESAQAESRMLDVIGLHGGFPVLNLGERPDLPLGVWLDARGRKWVDRSARASRVAR